MIKNPQIIIMIKSLVLRLETHDTMADHLKRGHCKGFCKEA